MKYTPCIQHDGLLFSPHDVPASSTLRAYLFIFGSVNNTYRYTDKVPSILFYILLYTYMIKYESWGTVKKIFLICIKSDKKIVIFFQFGFQAARERVIIRILVYLIHWENNRAGRENSIHSSSNSNYSSIVYNNFFLNVSPHERKKITFQLHHCAYIFFTEFFLQFVWWDWYLWVGRIRVFMSLL